MTPDQQFKRWIKWAMGAFVLVFAYFLLADLKMPLTPQAMATRVVTKMAPQVSGKVVEVAVGNVTVHREDVDNNSSGSG